MPAKRELKSKSATKTAPNPITEPSDVAPYGDARGIGVGPAIRIERTPEVQKEIALRRKLGPEKYQKLRDEREKEREAREAPIKYLLDQMVGYLVWFRPDLATEVIRQTVPLLPQKCLDIVRRVVQERQKALDKARRREGKPGKRSASETPAVLGRWMQAAWWNLVQGKNWREIAEQQGRLYRGGRPILYSDYVLDRQVKTLAGMVRAELLSCGAGGGERSLENALAWSTARAALHFKFGFPMNPYQGGGQRNRLLAQVLYFPGTTPSSYEQIICDAIDLARKLYVAGVEHEPTLLHLKKLMRRRTSAVSIR